MTEKIELTKQKKLALIVMIVIMLLVVVLMITSFSLEFESGFYNNSNQNTIKDPDNNNENGNNGNTDNQNPSDEDNEENENPNNNGEVSVKSFADKFFEENENRLNRKDWSEKKETDGNKQIITLIHKNGATITFILDEKGNVIEVHVKPNNNKNNKEYTDILYSVIEFSKLHLSNNEKNDLENKIPNNSLSNGSYGDYYINYNSTTGELDITQNEKTVANKFLSDNNLNENDWTEKIDKDGENTKDTITHKNGTKITFILNKNNEVIGVIVTPGSLPVDNEYKNLLNKVIDYNKINIANSNKNEIKSKVNNNKTMSKEVYGNFVVNYSPTTGEFTIMLLEKEDYKPATGEDAFITLNYTENINLLVDDNVLSTASFGFNDYIDFTSKTGRLEENPKLSSVSLKAVDSQVACTYDIVFTVENSGFQNMYTKSDGTVGILNNQLILHLENFNSAGNSYTYNIDLTNKNKTSHVISGLSITDSGNTSTDNWYISLAFRNYRNYNQIVNANKSISGNLKFENFNCNKING